MGFWTYLIWAYDKVDSSQDLFICSFFPFALFLCIQRKNREKKRKEIVLLPNVSNIKSIKYYLFVNKLKLSFYFKI